MLLDFLFFVIFRCHAPDKEKLLLISVITKTNVPVENHKSVLGIEIASIPKQIHYWKIILVQQSFVLFNFSNIFLICFIFYKELIRIESTADSRLNSAVTKSLW